MKTYSICPPLSDLFPCCHKFLPPLFEDVFLKSCTTDHFNLIGWTIVTSSNSTSRYFSKENKSTNLKMYMQASLMVQWLRICLPMQGTCVRALVGEDPTCRGATKPMRHNYWACALEPESHNYWAHVPQLLKPMCLESVLATREATVTRSPRTATKSSPCSPQLEKARVQQRRPNTAKTK